MKMIFHKTTKYLKFQHDFFWTGEGGGGGQFLLQRIPEFGKSYFVNPKILQRIPEFGNTFYVNPKQLTVY